jgi:hypothetical protein
MRVSEKELAHVIEQCEKTAPDRRRFPVADEDCMLDFAYDLRDARKELADIRSKSIEIGEGDKVMEYDVPEPYDATGHCDGDCWLRGYDIGGDPLCSAGLAVGDGWDTSPGPDCPQNGKIIVILKRSK